MDFYTYAWEILIAYRDAHLLWKQLPEGDEKKDALQSRRVAHSKALEVIKMKQERPP